MLSNTIDAFSDQIKTKCLPNYHLILGTSQHPINKEIIELPHIPKHKFDIYVFHFDEVMHTAFQPKIQYVYIKADTIVIKRVIYIVFLFAFITTPPLKPQIIHKRNIYHKLILLQDILLVIRICQHQIILISIIVLS